MTMAGLEVKSTSAPTEAVKVLSDDGDRLVIAGYGVRFGTVDLSGDRFSASTKYYLSEYARAIPVLWEHGMDAEIGSDPIGSVIKIEPTDVGLWVEAQLRASAKYLAAIRKLLPRLGWSSGALPSLVTRKSAGDGVTDIISWYLSEMSLTTRPCEPALVMGISEVGGSGKSASNPKMARVRAELAVWELEDDIRQSDQRAAERETARRLERRAVLGTRAGVRRVLTSLEANEAAVAEHRYVANRGRLVAHRVSRTNHWGSER